MSQRWLELSVAAEQFHLNRLTPSESEIEFAFWLCDMRGVSPLWDKAEYRNLQPLRYCPLTIGKILEYLAQGVTTSGWDRFLDWISAWRPDMRETFEAAQSAAILAKREWIARSESDDEPA